MSPELLLWRTRGRAVELRAPSWLSRTLGRSVCCRHYAPSTFHSRRDAVAESVDRSTPLAGCYVTVTAHHTFHAERDARFFTCQLVEKLRT